MAVRLIDANKIEFHGLNNRVCPDLSAMDIIDEQPTIDPETLPIVQELRGQIKTIKEMNSEYLCMMVDVVDILNAMYGSCGKFCDDCIQEFWDKWGDDSKKSGLSEEEKKKRNKFIRDVLNKKIIFYDGGNKKEE